MNSYKSLIFAMVLSLGFIHDGWAQVKSPSETRATIRLKDGSHLVGTIVQENDSTLTIKTDSFGEILLHFDKIDELERQTGGFSKNGHYWPSNPHSTRYFFSPSALPLKKGEGYYQNAYLFVNSINVGVTDQFSLGGGFVLNPSFRGWQVLFMTSKYSFPSESNVSFGIGAIGVGIFTTEYEYSGYSYNTYSARKQTIFTFVGMGYGLVTFGNKEDNLSLGMGLALSDGSFSGNPTFNFGLMKRIGRKVSLVSENWLVLPKSDWSLGILSGGVRLFGDKTSVDLALWVPASDEIGIFVMPYVDVVVKFGSKKSKLKDRVPRVF